MEKDPRERKVKRSLPTNKDPPALIQAHLQKATPYLELTFHPGTLVQADLQISVWCVANTVTGAGLAHISTSAPTAMTTHMQHTCAGPPDRVLQSASTVAVQITDQQTAPTDCGTTGNNLVLCQML